MKNNIKATTVLVLNLIINGLPSIFGAAYYFGKKQGMKF